jgi:hypothetical protein
LPQSAGPWRRAALRLVLAAACGFGLGGHALAQAEGETQQRRALAERIVKAQQGPEFDRMLRQLAESSAPDLIQQIAPRLEQGVPADKREQARRQLNDALQDHVADVYSLLRTKAPDLANRLLVPLYEQGFTVDELRTLLAFFESEANRKYQRLAPEFGQKLVQQLISDTQAQVGERGRTFGRKADEILARHGAPAAAPAGAASAPRAGASAAQRSGDRK